jgi:ribosomal-protein-alanine N-acetyltransferase
MEAITIEDLQVKDLSLVAKWLSRDKINRWLTAEWRNRVVSTTVLAIALRNRKNRFFLVRCNGEPCGLVALADVDIADATAMVWYFLGDSKYSGKGIASEAVRQLVRKAFKELKLRSLYAWMMEDNAASANVLRGVGFQEAGRIRQAVCSNGRQVDRIYFDLVASECPESDSN